MFSKLRSQLQEPARTEIRDLSSSLQLHVDSHCGVLRSSAKRGIDMDQQDTHREVEIITGTLASYSSLVGDRPNLEQGKSPTVMARFITCALYPTTPDN